MLVKRLVLEASEKKLGIFSTLSFHFCPIPGF